MCASLEFDCRCVHRRAFHLRKYFLFNLSLGLFQDARVLLCEGQLCDWLETERDSVISEGAVKH